MVSMHGELGQAWCDNLPAHLDTLCTLWQVDIGDAFPLSYNYVCRATRRHDGLPVVIKTCLKSNEFPGELQMLRHYAGHGAVQLLAADEERYAMLLAYVAPGTTLHAVVNDDDEATAIAAQLMRQSISPAPLGHTMPHTNDWAKGFTKLQTILGPQCTPFIPSDVTWATQIFANSEMGAAFMRFMVIYTISTSFSQAQIGSLSIRMGSYAPILALNAERFSATRMMYSNTTTILQHTLSDVLK